MKNKTDILIERVKWAAKLKEMRELSGLTQRDVCKEFGIEQGNYSRMERGLLKFKPCAESFILEKFIDYRTERIKALNHEIELLKNFIV